MTETPSTQLPEWATLDDAGQLDPVVPAGVDALDDLTVAELGHVGKLLKCDPYTAVKDPSTGLRWPALAHLVWVWARRTHGPAVKLDPILQLRPTQISQLIGFERDEPADDDDDANPTEHARA